MTEKELPGITFYLDQVEEGGVRGGKLYAKLTVTAVIDQGEESRLQKIKDMFNNGLRIHTVADFKEQMIRVLQGDVSEAERRAREIETELRTANAAKEAAEKELREYKQSFEFFKGRGSHE